jgi:hypothetical protein
MATASSSLRGAAASEQEQAQAQSAAASAEGCVCVVGFLPPSARLVRLRCCSISCLPARLAKVRLSILSLVIERKEEAHILIDD